MVLPIGNEKKYGRISNEAKYLARKQIASTVAKTVSKRYKEVHADHREAIFAGEAHVPGGTAVVGHHADETARQIFFWPDADRDEDCDGNSEEPGQSKDDRPVDAAPIGRRAVEQRHIAEDQSDDDDPQRSLLVLAIAASGKPGF